MIKLSYSSKYMGLINGNMGILTKRKEIELENKDKTELKSNLPDKTIDQPNEFKVIFLKFYMVLLKK